MLSKKALKMSLCIILSVILLFFSVNNSFFSPHKIDKVEAASIALGTGTVIAVDTVIKIITAIAVTGLGIGLISEWSDMDMEAMLQDFHDWLAENITVLDSLGIDGTSALKEWAQTDEWEVIEGGGGVNPSPSPDNDNNEESDVTKYPFGINGALNLSTIGLAAEAGNIAAEEFLNQYVSLDEGYISLARQYLEGKVNGYETSTSTDSITKALQSRYQPALIELPEGYAAWSTAQIVKWNAENLGYQSNSASITYEYVNGDIYKNVITFSKPVYFIPMVNNNNYNLIGVGFENNTFVIDYYANGQIYNTRNGERLLVNGYISEGINCPNSWKFISSTSQIPYYQSSNNLDIKKIGLGLLQEDLLSPFGKNYIDTNDEFGWASTAQLSPSDLLALGYGIDMSGMNISFKSLIAAIDALTEQLKENNPNSNDDLDPVIYPDVDTYIDTYKNVVTDPDIFPETSPGTDTETNPGTNTDTGTSLNYSGFLQTIINILQGIWDLLKQFLSWFIIDFPTIKAHLLSALASIPEFDVFEPILGYFDYFRTAITDNYDYPVISITTPDILLPYYQQPEIILVDFEDYAKYFVWARAIISFSLYFGFGIWLIKDIKIFFSGL